MAKQTAKGSKASSKLEKTAGNATDSTESSPAEIRIDAIPPEVHTQAALVLPKAVNAPPGEPATEEVVEPEQPAPVKETPPPRPAPL